MIECSYKCYECKFEWKGFRVLLDDQKVAHRLEGTGLTVCPECNHDYIYWTNYEKFAKWYRKHIGDGGCGGEIKNKKVKKKERKRIKKENRIIVPDPNLPSNPPGYSIGIIAGKERFILDKPGNYLYTELGTGKKLWMIIRSIKNG